MEFLIYLYTEARNFHNAGSYNVVKNGLDLIAYLFLYSVQNRTRCGRKICRYISGIIGAAKVCEVD